MTSVINKILDMKKEHNEALKELRRKVVKTDGTTNEPKRRRPEGHARPIEQSEGA